MMWLKALERNRGPYDDNLLVKMEEIFIAKCFLALILDGLPLSIAAAAATHLIYY